MKCLQKDFHFLGKDHLDLDLNLLHTVEGVNEDFRYHPGNVLGHGILDHLKKVYFQTFLQSSSQI